MNWIVWLYGLPCLDEIISANRLRTTEVVGPHPPQVEKTIGEKVPCSTSITLASYARLFSCSCFRKQDWDDDLQFEGAKELKTLTSKNAHLLLGCSMSEISGIVRRR